MVYGADEVFRGVSFSVQAGERIGVVGANGAGKSTLLRLIAGELEPTGGSLSVGGEGKIGYLRQSREGNPEDGSGGERARAMLEAILSGRPDILLLDEPTNHLDFEKLSWLEGRIRHFKGTILLVSHDRYFLDRTVSRIFDMGGGALTAYKGNYSAFREKKAALTEAAERAYKKDLAEYKRQEAMIRHMKERGTEKLAKRAASREKKLAREQRPEAIRTYDAEGRRMRIRFTEARRSGTDVLFAENLSKGFGERQLFNSVDIDLKRGETVCMVGANGVGKTTLFRILTGKLAQDKGYFERGAGVRIGYYDQHQENLCGGHTLLDEMREAFPTFDDTEHRRLLGMFLFSGDRVFQRIETLSGGERARLSLLKLIRSDANALLLDEPTNHLDIASMEVVEKALKDFTGTLFIISHDRYLLETLPDRIVELTPHGLINYPGKFDYYFEKKAATAVRSASAVPADGRRGGGLPPAAQSLGSHRDGGLPPAAQPPDGRRGGNLPPAAQSPDGWEGYKPETEAAQERRLAKEAETARRRLERRIAETESAIAAAEAKIASAGAALADEKNAIDHELLAALHTELTEAEAKVSSLLAVWEGLQEERSDGHQTERREKPVREPIDRM